MILFKPWLDVDIEKIASDDHGRYILVEIVIDETKVVVPIENEESKPKNNSQSYNSRFYSI